MVKILSKSGDSLADTYDVEGSIAGIEQLRSEEITLVHEMGSTLFSERVTTTIRRTDTGDVLQDTDFEIALTDLPAVPTRLTAVAVITSTPARILNVAVLLRDPNADREIPVWVWDQTNSLLVEIRDQGARQPRFMLVAQPAMTMLPILIGGIGQPQLGAVSQTVIAGRTTSFGAGNVDIQGLWHIAFSQIGGLSSRGLPIPGW